MAQITGSSTIDWSGISLAQIDFETDIVTFANRVDQIFTEFGNLQGTLVVGSPTLLVVDLFSGGRLTLGGSGFDTSPVINSFNFKNPPDGTGEVIRWAGTLDGIGTEIFTSATIGSTGFSETINGNIMFPATFPTSGNITATLTSLVVKIGSAKGTFSGNFNLTGNLSSASLTGKVTGISVVSGTDTIKMTGLSLSINVIEAALASGDLATVNDLFSVVGNQLAGNDTITYTNNSGVGMTFFGGAGNDTITVIGATADTLVGGTGNDKLIGGLGQDSIMGELGNDQITMLVTAGNVDTIDAGDDTDTLVLSGVVPGDHVVVVDLSSSTDQVVSIGGVADAPTQINFENLTASGIGSSVDVTGSDGENFIIGSNGNDSIDGGDGDDVLKGGGGDDVLTGGLGNDLLIGGTGNDTYTVDVASDVVTEGLAAGTDEVFASLTSTLGANVENLTLTGSAALNGTGNTLANVLTGNDGANVLTGGAGNDTLIGGLGEDTVTGGTENDRVEMLVTSGSVDVADGGAGLDTLALVGAVGGDGIAVVNLAAGAGDQVTSIGGTPDDTLVQKNFERLDASGLGISSSVNVTGSAGANLMIGSNGNDQLTGNAGNDTLNGGAGDDTLLSGGDGNDVILIGAAADHGGSEVIDGGAGADVIRFTSVTGGEELTLSAGVTVESVVIANAAGVTTGTTALDVDASAVVSNGLTVIGNAGVNTLTGTGLNDVLKGAGGSDTLRGGLGNDTVNGGSGNDTFLFGSGDGQDLVQDNSGSADKILFDSGINPLDLVISRHADNLRLAIHGSSDQITVQNWYTSSVNRTETIQAGNGDTLSSTQVNQLIQAMAGFTQQTGLTWDQAIDQQPQEVQAVLAASWQ